MNIVIGILIIIVASGIGMASILLVRRRAPDGGFFNDGDRAAGVFGVLATGFAVLLGFIVFLAFASYDQSRSGAETEALMVFQQAETAQFLGGDAPSELSGELACYGRYVVNREWPLMEDQNLGDTFNPWGLAMFNTLQTIEPDGPTEEAAYDKWLDQTSAREEARLDRIHGAEGILPGPLWVALFLMAAVIFTYMMFFADSGERWFIQALHVGAVVAVITATLLVIQMLTNPFNDGPGGLQPTAMERTLRALEGPLADAVGLDDPPCTESGDEL